MKLLRYDMEKTHLIKKEKDVVNKHTFIKNLKIIRKNKYMFLLYLSLLNYIYHDE